MYFVFMHLYFIEANIHLTLWYMWYLQKQVAIVVVLLTIYTLLLKTETADFILISVPENVFLAASDGVF